MRPPNSFRVGGRMLIIKNQPISSLLFFTIFTLFSMKIFDDKRKNIVHLYRIQLIYNS